MISSTTSRGSVAIVAAIVAASFSVGMIATTRFTCVHRLQRSPQPAHGLRRRVAQQRCCGILVGRAVPDLAQCLLCRVAQRIAVVAARRERRDAARQRAAMRGEIHQRPRPPARRPGLRVVLPLQAEARFGGAGCIQRNAQLARQRRGVLDRARFLGAQRLEQRRFRARQAIARIVVHQPLQMNLRAPPSTRPGARNPAAARSSPSAPSAIATRAASSAPIARWQFGERAAHCARCGRTSSCRARRGRTSRSAASSDTRSSSSPVSISAWCFFGVSSVPLVLNST